MIDWLHPKNLFTVVCRPALPKDTTDVMELTRTIWGGEDYVPHVWAEWLADPEGMLAVAEYGGRVVGLSKLTRLSLSEWWLEGLRVHPEYEGRGIASRLHDYLDGYWERNCGGWIRLATASFRIPVQHLTERSGFHRIGEFTEFAAPALEGPGKDQGTGNFNPLSSGDVPQAAEFARNSPALPLHYGLMDLGWRWAWPAPEHLEAAVKECRAWWWQGRSGLLITGEEEEGEGHEAKAMIQFVACLPQAMPACLLDFRQLAAGQGFTRVGWTAPMHPDLAPILESAGFERTWDASIYIYEKEHP